MDEKAFFFQSDALLLPEGFPDSAICGCLPLELSKDFDSDALDIFEVPAIEPQPGRNDKVFPLDEPSSLIRAVSVQAESVLPRAWKTVPVRRVLSLFGAGEAGALIRACHIAQWRRSSRFCGCCGAKNNDVLGEAQRVCPNCGRIEFPRICPAIIVIITNEKNSILLAHNKKFRTGVYSHISGFNEAGETLESTVIREVREEVDIDVKDVTYVKSQPWPFPNSLMIGFKARFLSGAVKPDGGEIEDAAWFSRDNLPELPAEGSLSRYLINNWLAGEL